MSVSDWFSDEELISQLGMFFDVEEDIDYQSLLGQIIEVDEDVREIKVKGRLFRFSMEFCDVEEVT